MCQGGKKALDFTSISSAFSVVLPKSRPVGDTTTTRPPGLPAHREAVRYGTLSQPENYTAWAEIPTPASQAQAAKWGGAPVNYYLLGKGKGSLSPLPVEE